MLLGVAQLGYGYYMKREVQKAADLAALSAVQVLGTGAAADCSRARRRACRRRWPICRISWTPFRGRRDRGLQPWDPTPVGGMPLFDPASGQLPNAMRACIGKTLGNVIPSAFVGGDTVVSVQAVATSTQPVAAFTVGSRLLRLEKGGLPSKILASVGATPQQLDVLDAAGLATVNITPSGLLDALGLPLSVATGVARPLQLAAVSNPTLGQLLNATLTVINKAGTAAADITLLNNAIKTVLQVMPLNLPVKLFGDGGVLDLQVGGSVTSALQANVNALNILQTALVIANGQNLIDLG